MTLRTIHLHGDLARFGGPFSFDVATPREAVRALCSQLPGFRKRLMQPGSAFQLLAETIEGVERSYDEEGLTAGLGRAAELHLMPVVQGAKDGIIPIILGVTLIAAAFAFAPAAAGAGAAAGAAGGAAAGGAAGGLGATAFSLGSLGTVAFADIALLGAGIALFGVSSLLSPQAGVGNIGDREDPRERPSFLFNGAVNVSAEGEPVPIIYGGPIRVGSVVVSAGVKTEDVLS